MTLRHFWIVSLALLLGYFMLGMHCNQDARFSKRLEPQRRGVNTIKSRHLHYLIWRILFTVVYLGGLHGRVVKASRFETTRSSPLWFGFESHERQGSCQLLTEGCWFTPRNKLFLQLWKLTAIYDQIRLKNGVKQQFMSPHLL